MNHPFLQPGRAPGRSQGDAPPPPPPAAPKDGTQQDGAPATGPPPGDPGPFGGMGLMLPMLLVVFGLFFFMNRNEKKRRSKLEDNLKKGDKVLTRAGFIGKVVEIGETRCRIEIAPGVNVTVVKQAIEGPADDEVKKLESKDAKSKDDKKDDEEDKSSKKRKKK